jgi:hypothetical protein
MLGQTLPMARGCGFAFAAGVGAVLVTIGGEDPVANGPATASAPAATATEVASAANRDVEPGAATEGNRWLRIDPPAQRVFLGISSETTAQAPDAMDLRPER